MGFIACRTGIFKWKIFVGALFKKYLKFPVRSHSHSCSQESLLCWSGHFPFPRLKDFRFFSYQDGEVTKAWSRNRLCSLINSFYSNTGALCGHLSPGHMGWHHLAHQICNSEGTVPRSEVNGAQELAEKMSARFGLCPNTGLRFVV